MFAVISPEKIEIPPGAVFQIPGSWDDYETLSQHQITAFILTTGKQFQEKKELTGKLNYYQI